ncbi:lytic transglycosylase F [Cytophagales bacterium WSM2-2]|nr:lytic transglycosylase F [Cytophagales bacterium WSM2-2]
MVDCKEKAKLTFATEPGVVRDLKEIQKRGYIEALLDNNSISYFIYRGRTMGYEYELLKLIAADLKVDLRIKVISGVEEAIDRLNRGQGDIIAFPLTITKERTAYVSFTSAFLNTYQVLVQKRPENWREHTADENEKEMLRNPADLIGKEVYVIKESSFKNRLKHLSEEIGGEIIVREDSADAETESLIQKVANNEIKYTVADHMLARINQFYYPDLDINTVLSLSQQIAWATRKNSPALNGAINNWIARIKVNGTLPIIKEKYFNSPRFSVLLASSDYSTLSKKKLSPYDDQLRKGAEQIGWDWRLLASLVYQESQFDPNVKSWVGAIGLMQVMPETGDLFGVSNLWNPQQNIATGVRFIKYLDDYWKKTVENDTERLKFVLASYNVGLSHVIDAQKLTQKYGRKMNIWDDNVEYYLAQKSNPKYYRDPLVGAGYCRCDGPVWYVKQVLQRFEEYKIHIAS